MEIPADHVAQFFYEGEVIGVVWGSSDPLEDQEDISVWEVFFLPRTFVFIGAP